MRARERFSLASRWRDVPGRRAAESGGIRRLRLAGDRERPVRPARVRSRCDRANPAPLPRSPSRFLRSPMVVARRRLGSPGELERPLRAGARDPGSRSHNERRFSVPLGAARRARLRYEFVESPRAIWRSWETGAPLAYEGEHYRFTLMTPEFSPPRSGFRRYRSHRGGATGDARWRDGCATACGCTASAPAATSRRS